MQVPKSFWNQFDAIWLPVWVFGWLVRFSLNRLWACITTNDRHTVLIQPATVKMVSGDGNGSSRFPRALKPCANEQRQSDAVQAAPEGNIVTCSLWSGSCAVARDFNFLMLCYDRKAICCVWYTHLFELEEKGTFVLGCQWGEGTDATCHLLLRGSQWEKTIEVTDWM